MYYTPFPAKITGYICLIVHEIHIFYLKICIMERKKVAIFLSRITKINEN